MKHTLMFKIVFLVIVVAFSATQALAGADAFNRAKIGASWAATSGTLSISNHQLVGTTGALGYHKASLANTGATAVVFLSGTSLQYGAIALGSIATGTDAFVKIQEQNGSGMFEYGAFYTGNNGGGYFFTLTPSVPSPATLDVFFCGTTATMRITSSVGIQTYTYNYGTTFGTGAGLGTYGPISLDNFIGFAGTCSSSPTGAMPALAMPSALDLSIGK